MIEMARDHEELRPRISVIGVGGAGGNAVANMMRGDLKGVTFIAVNTDAQALQASPAPRIVQLGLKTTQGLGAGSSAEIGRQAAEESIAGIEAMLDGAHMCFIAAGLGGGTGTGAAPVIAKAARARGILTVGVVTKPFAFEGKRRAQSAEEGLIELQKHVDTLIVIPNQNLFRVASPSTTFKAAFDMADDVLQQGVRGITDLMTVPGLINLDFADVRTIMANMGKAMMGTGEASGDNRAINAAEQAISNPLLDEAMKGARGLIISISGGDDLGLMEVDEAANYIKDMVDPEADIIWGSAFNPELDGRIRVSVVATGVDAAAAPLDFVMPAIATAQPKAAAALARAAFAASWPSATTHPPIVLEAPALEPVAFAAAADPVSEDELLLTVERPLVLTPPENAPALATIDPFAPADAAPVAGERGPSLFERMAMLAKGTVKEFRDADGDPLPRLFRGRDYHGEADYLDRRARLAA